MTNADPRDAERCDHVPPRLALRDRLALAALVAGVTLWIRVGELFAGTRDREVSSKRRFELGARTDASAPHVGTTLGAAPSRTPRRACRAW